MRIDPGYVCLLDRARERLEGLAAELRADGTGIRVVTVYGDVAVEEDVRRLVEEVVEELGGMYAVSGCTAGNCERRRLRVCER